jgi:hypothetical protein
MWVMLTPAVALICSIARWKEEPTPMLAKFSVPGLARALASSACTESTPSEGRVSSSTVSAPTGETGTRSRSGSKSSGRCAAAAMTRPEVAQNSRLCPSGVDLAIADAAMLPPAPPRFSTTTGLPSAAPSFSPSRRAMASVLAPGGKQTVMETGRLGQGDWACACASGAASSSAAASATPRRSRPVHSGRMWLSSPLAGSLESVRRR